MAEESAEQRRDRWRSVGFTRAGRKPKEKIVVRPNDGSLDAGQRAKMVINADRDVVTTTSDNRQDANVFGTGASASPAGGVG
jgi:hypothetical protein